MKNIEANYQNLLRVLDQAEFEEISDGGDGYTLAGFMDAMEEAIAQGYDEDEIYDFALGTGGRHILRAPEGTNNWETIYYLK